MRKGMSASECTEKEGHYVENDISFVFPIKSLSQYISFTFTYPHKISLGPLNICPIEIITM